MVVLDINTKKVIYESKDFPGHVFWSTKEYRDKYVAEITIWGMEFERKILYG